MSNNLNPSTMVVAPAPAIGATDAYFDAAVSYSLGSAVAQVVPVGMWYLLANAHASLQGTSDAAGTTWSDIYPVTVGGFFWSDGTNIRLLGDSTGSNAVKIIPKM